MPLSYEIDVEKNLMLVHGEKGLSYEDVIAHQKALLGDDRIRPGMRSLVDLRKLTAFEMAGRDVFNLAQTREEYPFFSAEGRTAVIVGDETAFAMARMYMLSRKAYVEPMGIFYSEEEAYGWLGLEYKPPGEPPATDSSAG